MNADFDGGKSVGIRERSPIVILIGGDQSINIAAASLLRHDAAPLVLVLVNTQHYLDCA